MLGVGDCRLVLAEVEVGVELFGLVSGLPLLPSRDSESASVVFEDEGEGKRQSLGSFGGDIEVGKGLAFLWE